MTKEEIEKVWSWIDSHFHDTEIDDSGESVNIVSSDMMVFKDDLYQDFYKDFQVIEPSLPSTLDEAAKYHRAHGLYGGDINLAMEDSFKAGAEWMARQGISYEDEVTGDEFMGFCLEFPSDMVALEDHFNAGDKVIVQVRKKK